jgi:Holliday junction DNA helicase RuvA
VYEYLVGRIVSRAATRIVLDVGGIGYDVAVPLGAGFKGEGDAEDERVRVWTHFVVREDAHALFGFPDPGMRELFRLLLRVRGVGPGLAQGILSSLPEGRLLEAIAAGDPAPLTRIKGVGKKTADQILLDLRDRAPRPGDLGPDTIVPPGPGGAASTRTMADAVTALLSIGYTDKQARASVERAAGKVPTTDLEELVRAALQE